MDKKQTIPELVKGIVAEMELLRYTPLSIHGFRYACSGIIRYVREKTGADIYSKELGEEYLKDVVGYPFESFKPQSSFEGQRIRCVKRLDEYHETGKISKLSRRKETTDNSWHLGDEDIIKAFLESVQTADNSEATKNLRTHHTKLFYEFLKTRNVRGVQALSPQIISEYALSLSGISPVYAKHLLATLRFFLKFIHESGLCSQDWSVSVPKVAVPKNLNVPALWDKSDVERLLKSIDRGSPAGKRDYAVILLVVQLGLRVHDVAELKLESLDWAAKKLDIVQHKTGTRLTHHLFGDTGWAIIDYIRYGRPNVDEPYVFLSINAPYTKITTTGIGNILNRRMQRCGMKKQPGTTNGMHSLRHALAQRLLAQGNSLQSVADIMGHTKYSSTLEYLKSDIDGLRECALSLGGEHNA